MYAVIRTGGKQYRVAKDEVVTVERLVAEPGASVELGDILMLDDGSGPTIGAPLVAGARVTATVIEHRRADKILVFKKKRRKNYRRTQGHRQNVTVLRVTGIVAAGAAKPSRARAQAETEAAEAAAPAATEE